MKNIRKKYVHLHPDSKKKNLLTQKSIQQKRNIT